MANYVKVRFLNPARVAPLRVLPRAIWQSSRDSLLRVEVRDSSPSARIAILGEARLTAT
jgi:hypothetical protein